MILLFKNQINILKIQVFDFNVLILIKNLFINYKVRKME